MAEIVAKVLVLGGGPGGYVSAIRAGQLGLDVVLVEQGGLDGGLGGTCLNVGCIPSKAIIHAADAYAHATEQAKSAPFGLRVERPTIDFARTIEWKDGIVGRLTSGESLSVGRDGASDAVSFLAAGVPAVEFGPIGDGHHGPAEWVSISSLRSYRQALEGFVRSFPGMAA